MKKLLVTIVVLAALVVALDRGSVFFASYEIATKVQSSQQLSSKPTVVIHGVPFLTQVADGKYTSIDITARDLVVQGVRLASVTVHAQGVHVSLSDAIGGRVTQVPVDHGSGTVVVDYPELNTLAKKYASAGAASVTLAAAGADRVAVGGMISVLGISTGISAQAQITVSGEQLHIVPLVATLDELPAAIRGDAKQLLTIDIPLPKLPFGLHLQSGVVNDAGVTATAGGSQIVIPLNRAA